MPTPAAYSAPVQRPRKGESVSLSADQLPAPGLPQLCAVSRALARSERADQAIAEALAVTGRAVRADRIVAVFDAGAGAGVEATRWCPGADDPARQNAADTQARATFAYLRGAGRGAGLEAV